MKRFKLLFLLFFVSTIWAQTTTATLGPVNENGLHRIYLPPGIRSYSEISLSDFRIYDASGNQVPYQIPSATYDGIQTKFIPYKITSRETVSKKTSITAENPNGEITEITLRIANAEVTKKFSISGSDDGKTWFGLVNSRELSEITNESSTDEFKIISLPRNKYRYIRFDIDDKKTLPLNILEIGEIRFIGAGKPRIENVKPVKMTFEQLPEHKATLVHVVFDHAQWITEFGFDITAPNHYNREVTLYSQVPYRYKRKKGIREQVIQSFTLSSEHTNKFFEPFYQKEFYLRIENRDNPPLTIKDIVFSQKLQWVVADLKAGENYTVETGNPQIPLPDYDLSYSEDKLHGDLPEAVITKISHTASREKRATAQTLWQKPWFLWACIGIAAVVILYFSLSLVKDMKRG